MIVVNTPRAIKDHVAAIVGKAAWCALDFKQDDPTSITETRHCVQDCYETLRDQYLERVAMCSSAEREGGLVPREISAARDAAAVKLWDDVKAALNSIGFTW